MYDDEHALEAETEAGSDQTTGEQLAGLLDLLADALKRRGFDAVWDALDSLSADDD